MLEVKQLTKKYGEVAACSDLNFLLPDGSITILLGPNGAGKSTVMKAITGFLRFNGSIIVDGIDNYKLESRRIIGYAPEIPSFYPNLTVAEHLEFIARAYRLKNYKQRAENLLKRFELYDHRKKFGDELSKGMQQKLNLCIAMLTEPRVILLDEPFIGLDPHAIKELRNLILEKKEEGCTILISTHIIDSVETLWDRTIIMKKGKIRADIGREDLKEGDPSLEDIFFEITEGKEQ